jgi:two-component system OmpR family sensor kinase
LIDNLLNSSRLIDGAAAHYFHPAELDVAPLLYEVCQLHREMVPTAQIAEQIANVPMQTVGDPKLLFQVFSNLLGNAVKYSPSGGAIDVEAAIVFGDIVVTFSDRGIGIPQNDLERLFERYHRGSNVSGIVGTGVGLYLVKMVVDMHRGQVDVQSREGQGSRFTVRLPIRHGMVKESPPLVIEPVALEDASS